MCHDAYDGAPYPIGTDHAERPERLLPAEWAAWDSFLSTSRHFLMMLIIVMNMAKKVNNVNGYDLVLMI